MPALFRCRICKAPALRPAVSAIYSRANVCGEKCHGRFRELSRQRYAKAAPKPCRVRERKRPKPEPLPVVAAVPVLDRVDAIFERARAAVWAAGLGRVGTTRVDDD